MASRLISVAIYDRDNFSRGHMRQVFGYEAFHWGLLMGPEFQTETSFWAFEATDANFLDPVTFRMNNPSMDWWYKPRDSIDWKTSSKLLGRFAISEVPEDMTYAEMEELLHAVPLPVKNQEPQQSCVTWVVNAIKLLQERDLVPPFDIKALQDGLMVEGDKRIASLGQGGYFFKYYPEVQH